ncbi:MAG: cation-translocating P-type ATPase [Wenzhouxiangella sp.]
MTDKPTAWHHLEPDDCRKQLEASADGLSNQDAQTRLEHYGPNRLPEAAKRPAWLRFLSQFHNVFIYVLLAAAVIAALLAQWVDTGVILAVVIINALIGYIQEGKAEQAMAAIGKMLALSARVRRDGQWQEIDADQLVPGDRVRLKAGDRIPADIRLTDAHDLRTDQAALTGESLSVGKNTAALDEDTELAERSNMVYSGTMATNGQGEGIVVVTGGETELGRISGMLDSVETLTTPLLNRINRFAKVLTVIILVLATAVIALGAILHGLPIREGLLAGIALAVAAIPEGLPAIITITLAIGVQQMAGRKAIIRRLPAVETLGSVTIICSDKTGTLTRNELRARALGLCDGVTHAGSADKALLEQDRDDHRRLARVAVLCNDAEPDSDSGDPLERALLELAADGEVDVAALREQHDRTHLIPFSSDHKYMASLHGQLLTVKGAPEVILERCQTQTGQDGDQPLDADAWHERIEAMASEGLRVLALADKTIDPAPDKIGSDEAVADLTLLGLVGFADPPRDEVPDAVKACQSAGIRIKMITGDNAVTARAIASELGLIKAEENALSGRDIDRLDDDELAEQVMDTHVFARTTPEHKLRLVKALQKRGQVVAMTGDGANDAPALKRADIGVAMGIKGTEASRQAAEMVLADDNFATIVGGIEEGRGVYDNIRKAVLFLLPTNGAQSLVILLAVLAGLSLPITPVQILWVNMVVAVTLALALAFEPLEGDIMKRRPRSLGQPLLSHFVVFRVVWISAVMTLGTFGLYQWLLEQSQDPALARTLAVNVLVAAQIAYLFNCRRWQAASFTPSALLSNRWAWLSVTVLILLQLGFTYLPAAQAVFDTAAMALDHWLLAIAFGLIIFVLVEIEKLFTRALSLRFASPEG